MTVPSETNLLRYTGTGLVTTYPYTFKIYDQDHLEVIEVTPSGTETVLTRGVDYTVTGVVGGVGSPTTGGNVVLTDALTADYVLIIRRVLPGLQEINLRDGGSFYPSTHEKAWDLLVMLIQMALYPLGYGNPDLSRCLMLGVSDVIGSGAYHGLANRITNIADPTLDQDAATKLYVDLAVSAVGAPGMDITLYTDATRPEAGVLYDGKLIRYKESGKPVQFQICWQTSITGTYYWHKITEANPF